MKTIVAYTLLCPHLHDGELCNGPLRDERGMMPVFLSETQAQLAIVDMEPAPIVKRVRVLF